MDHPINRNWQTIRFALELFSLHPRRTLIVFLSYVVAGMAEGLGIAALLPILSLASSVNVPEKEPSLLADLVTGLLGLFGLQPTLLALLTLLVVAISAKAILIYVANTQAGFANADVATTLRLRLIKGLIRAHWRLFVAQPVGALANGMALETDNTANAYSAACMTVSMGVQALVYGGTALLISWKVTAVALFAGALLILIFARFVGMVRRAGDRWAVAMSELSNKLVDGFTGFKALKAMAREKWLYVRLEHEVMEIRAAIRSWTRILQLRGALEEPAIAIFIAAGLFFYLRHEPVPFEALVLMVGLFYRGVSRLTMLQKHYGGVAQLEMFYRQLSAKIGAAEKSAEIVGGRDVPSRIGDIRFANVDFAYGDRAVLVDLNIEIKPRSLTVIYGPSGSGKSTLIDILLGLSKPQGGRVWIGGEPLDELNLADWRGKIGFVPQEILLFNDTLFNNVTLGDPSIGREAVEASLREAGAWDFVDKMPDGIATMVGERGSKLSGGQRQRIALARALVMRPELLILDEATSALDPETEAEIWAGLKEMTARHTVVAITHQPAVLHLADEVIDLAHKPIPVGSGR